MIVYHGTLNHHARGIAKGIVPSLGRSHTDFGIGFYTTTSLIQAQSWAWQAAQAAIIGGRPSARGIVLAFSLNRDRAAGLESLSFVRGDYNAEDYWSLVFHCRQGHPGHGRTGINPFYDVVIGPVAAFWQQRVMMQNADQISFHSTAATDLLVPEPSLTVKL